MSKKENESSKKNFWNQVVLVVCDGIEKEMTAKEYATYLDQQMNSYTVEDLVGLVNKDAKYEYTEVDRFWSIGLDDRERLQAESISPEKNLRIVVSIINPYTGSSRPYTYKLDNFPKRFGVDINIIWAAYLAKYSFYTLGKFLHAEKNKKSYYIGNLTKPPKKTVSKKKPNKVSKKIFKKFFK